MGLFFYCFFIACFCLYLCVFCIRYLYSSDFLLLLAVLTVFLKFASILFLYCLLFLPFDNHHLFNIRHQLVYRRKADLISQVLKSISKPEGVRQQTSCRAILLSGQRLGIKLSHVHVRNHFLWSKNFPFGRGITKLVRNASFS